VACFIFFDVLWFTLNWFFTLIAFAKKETEVPMQTGVRIFGQAKTNYIIAKHVHLLFRSSAISCLVWSACEMTCFPYRTGQQLFILFMSVYHRSHHATCHQTSCVCLTDQEFILNVCVTRPFARSGRGCKGARQLRYVGGPTEGQVLEDCYGNHSEALCTKSRRWKIVE